MFVPISERWVAHASCDRFQQAWTNPRVCFGGMPLQRMPATAGKLTNGQAFQPARETRALPNDLFWTWFVDNTRNLQ
jgi:hypothetical protein